MDFWERLDALLASSEFVIDRPQGTTHPSFPDVVYPLDYGYLKGTTGGDGAEIDVLRGSRRPPSLDGIACAVDSLKRDSEVKLLVGCTDAEIELVSQFFNGSEYMSGVIIRRE